MLNSKHTDYFNMCMSNYNYNQIDSMFASEQVACVG